MHSATQSIRVLIVDDHAGMREGIKAIINAQPDMVVVGEAEDGDEAIAQFGQLQPDITVVDLNLPTISGIQVIRTLYEQSTGARLLAVTAASGDQCIRQALCAGAKSYLHKDMLRRELVTAIRALHQGSMYIPRAIAERLKTPG